MKGTVPSSIAESAQMAENAWYPARAMFVNPLTDGRKEPFGSLPNESLYPKLYPGSGRNDGTFGVSAQQEPVP